MSRPYITPFTLRWSVPAAAFPTPSAISRAYGPAGILNRNATRRWVQIVNRLDQAPTDLYAYPYDTGPGFTGTVYATTGMHFGGIAVNNTAYGTYPGTEVLNSPVDSMVLLFTAGAVAPAAGTLDIYVSETF